MNVASKLIGLLTCIFAAQAALAAEVNTTAGSKDDHWSFGAALGMSPDADMFKVTTKSKVLFAVEPGRWFVGEYSLFADLGGLTVRNVPVEGERRLQQAGSLLVSAGLETRQDTPALPFSTYAQWGVCFLDANDDLWTKTAQIGGKLVIGFEVPVGAYKGKLSDTEVLGAWFAEYQIHFGFQRADKLAGEPDLVNGGSMLIGARSYY